MMTPNQSYTLWHLRRKGLQLEAELAEAAWAQGRAFTPDASAPLTRETLQLIEGCNREIQPQAQPQPA
jgi:hypothetical protein